MRKIPAPKYKIWNILVGHCHPSSKDTIMIEVIDAKYDSQYGKWVYRGEFEGESVEMWEHDVDYCFKSAKQ